MRIIWSSTRRLALVAALVVLATGAMVAGDQSGREGPPGLTFVGDLAIRHQRIAADGRPAGVSPPALLLRFDRRHVDGRWRTRLDVVSSEPTWVQSPAGRRSLDNLFAPSRIEFDDDGTPPRMYDRRGQLIKAPTAADIRALGVPGDQRQRDWTPEELIARAPQPPGLIAGRGPSAGFLSLVSERAPRRAALERRFGQPAGQVRGLDRFLSQGRDSVQELLVHPDTALPVEINIAEAGQLVSHATLDYEPFGGTALLRRHVRHEQVLTGTSGTRLVTDIELTNVRTTEGGR